MRTVRAFMRQLKLILAGVLFVFVLLGLIWFRLYFNPVTSKTLIINVPQGVSVRTLAKNLKEQGVIQHPLYFILLARLHGVDHKMQAGKYRVEAGTTPDKLLNQIAEGKVIMHPITFVEGWKFIDVKHALDNNSYIKHTIIKKTPQQIMAVLGHASENPEGQFYPDTYLFGEGIADVVILKKAYRKMHQLLFNAWQHRAKNLPYKSPYEALILASLVEKETNLAYEKPEIAGVLVRRLKRNMRLQVDPTVIYALGKKFDGDITKQDLQIKSPYNTYLNKGLPPTPIGLPDKISIRAALHPAPGKTLYYVATGDGDHIFSETLEEHNKAVAEYIEFLESQQANHYYGGFIKQLPLPLCLVPR